ncbi:MAG: radical SAM protein [Candidatus Caldarchaeales archaeon]
MLKSTRLIRIFDPWRSSLCTCPPKYSFDPYTGCSHRCLYCYASSYVKDFYNCRPKKNLIKIVRRDLEDLPEDILISMSNSSDPYPRIERELELTRKCLEEFKNFNLRILIITKSNLVVRDIDLLKELKAAVTITITTLDKSLARKIEPLAPSPSERLEALSILSEERIGIGLRLDPIIPFINDGYKELLKEARDVGVKHVVSSTFKPRYDSWRRISNVFPDIREKLERIYYSEGERIGRSWYASRELRFKIMKDLAEQCRKLGLSFATCREGFRELHSSRTCDGSHLIEAVR